MWQNRLLADWSGTK